MNLILKSCSSYYGEKNIKDDYVVLDTKGQVVGRIMLHPQAPEDKPWFWTITDRWKRPSIDDKGYSATRENAMADFKARWARS